MKQVSLMTDVTGILQPQNGGIGVDSIDPNVVTFLQVPTSANLKAAVTDETGLGDVVFSNSPMITTPTGIVKGDVGLGNVDNTSDLLKPISTATQTALDTKAGPYSIGTWTPSDQSGAGLTFTVQTVAGYTRIGNIVVAYAYIGFPVTANGSNISIGGLPFATANQRYGRQGSLSYSATATAVYAWPVQNGTTFGIYTSAGAAMTNANLSNGDLYVNFIYPVS